MAQDPQTSSVGKVAATVALPPLPAFPSGQDVYDGVMGGIEPELTTSQLPLLSQKYQNETQDDARIRSERYTKAFAEYDRRYAAFSIELENAVHTYQKVAGDSVEQHSKMQEEQELSNLEQSISTM